MVAMGAAEFSFVSETTMKVKETVADFAFNLRASFPVVEVKIF